MHRFRMQLETFHLILHQSFPQSKAYKIMVFFLILIFKIFNYNFFPQTLSL